jgi:spectinomycin phosphotransferase/16S rRNA (guanine(1405)-N(7))-methyltransferase
VLTPPDDLPEDVLASALRQHWDVDAVELAYRPVGFGSYHWEVTDAAGRSWFATADQLANKRLTADETLDTAFGRLRAALAVASALRAQGCSFVLAPVAAADGAPLARTSEQFTVALYPFVHGESFEWDDFPGPRREAMLGMIIAVHGASPSVRDLAMPDSFVVPLRDQIEAAIAPGTPVPDCGPYASQAAALVTGHAAAIRRLLARYDELTAQARAQPERAVVTHGEPHPGNMMRTADGWLLIDWDMALLAQPERDLWTLDLGDGSGLHRYAEATGVKPQPAMLEMYRLRWSIADIAMDLTRFRQPHGSTDDDQKSWRVLRAVVEGLDS